MMNVIKGQTNPQIMVKTITIAGSPWRNKKDSPGKYQRG